MRKILLLLLLILSLSSIVLAEEEARFPRPEFSSGYNTPVEKEPAMPWQRSTDIAAVLLALSLAYAAHSLHYKRSRKRLVIGGLLCLVWFGFIYQGCVCPVGSIQNVALSTFSSNYFLPVSIVFIFLLPLIFALFFGRVFCGSVCPFGVLQDLLIFKPIKIPPILDRIFRLIPFAILGITIWFAISGLGFLTCKYDPFVALFRFSGPKELIFKGFAFLLLGIFVARPYCRYICPYSVLLSIAALFSWKKVQIYSDNCVKCNLCLPACPVDAIDAGKDQSSPNQFQEERKTAISRLKWLVALSPFIISMGIFSGIQLGKKVAPTHDLLRLQANVQNNNSQEDDYIAFYVNDGNTDSLNQRASEKANAIVKYGGVFGGYMSIVFIGAIFMATRRRTNTYHEVQTWNCVSCGRCYSWCPRNRNKK